MRSVVAQHAATRTATRQLQNRLESIDRERDALKHEADSLLRQRVSASTLFASIFRAHHGKRMFQKKLRQRRMIIKIQALWRGKCGSAEAQARRRALHRLAQPGYALTQLIRNSKVLRQIGKWREMRDERTTMVYYFCARDSETQWDPPHVFEGSFDCNWGYCTKDFENLLDLMVHRREHGWRCPACLVTNSCNNFPKCISCSNRLDGHGFPLGQPIPDLMDKVELIHELLKRKTKLHKHRTALVRTLNENIAEEEKLLVGHGPLSKVLAKRITRIPVPSDSYTILNLEKYYRRRRPSNAADLDSEIFKLAEQVVDADSEAGIYTAMNQMLKRPTFDVQNGGVFAKAKEANTCETEAKEECPTDENGHKILSKEQVDELREIGRIAYEPYIRNGKGNLKFASGATYNGEIGNKQMHGRGEMIFNNGATYRGEFANGHREGIGILRSADGSVYEGGWKNGLRFGHGILKRSNGEEYVGEWSEGKPHGTGRLSSANGDVYQGGFDHGVYHGKCSFTKLAGDKFVGVCVHGKVDGFGVLKEHNGQVYSGGWKADMRFGKGKCTFANGNVFLGWWKDGKLDGPGRFENKVSGECYDGLFERGRVVGLGRYHFVNGDVYVGMFVNGRAHGEGTYFYRSTGYIYTGGWVNDEKSGQGDMILPSGARFSGSWAHNNISGSGIMTMATGTLYKGRFRDSMRHGRGEMKWANGNVYRGMFRRNAIYGKGTMQYATGHTYVGEWRENKRHGSGEMKYNDGNVYTGAWKNDRKHGQGLLVYFPETHLRESYEGEWEEDLRCGKGVYRYCDGAVYVGMWKDGARHGEGHLTFAEGNSFEGDFVKDEIRGHGRMQFPDGRLYEGELEDQLFHGHGELIKPNGDRYVGEFRRGFKHGSGVLYYGNTEGKNSFRGQWQRGKKVGQGVYTLTTYPQFTEEEGVGEALRMPVFAG